jgi:uncharacterized membrane protein
MHIPPESIPAPLRVTADIAFLGACIAAYRFAPWGRLREANRFNVYLATIVSLSVLWWLRAGIASGMTLHVLGAMLMTLMFGPTIAAAGMAAVLTLATLYGVGHWGSFTVEAFMLGALPVGIAQSIHWLVARFLPRHFFVFIFLTAFMGAGLTLFATALGHALLLNVLGARSWPEILHDYLPYAAMLSLPEAVLTGSTVALMVVYRPQWVVSFDDALYLRR